MPETPAHYWIYAAIIAFATIWFAFAGLRSPEPSHRRLSLIGVCLLAATGAWLGLPLLAARLGSPIVQGLLGDAGRLFGVVWWIIFALFALVLLERFVWRILESREVGAPKLLKDVVRALVLIVAMFGIVSAAFDESFTGVLAASGVLAVVIGFAMQSDVMQCVGRGLRLEPKQLMAHMWAVWPAMRT